MARDSWSGADVDEPVRRVVASLLRLASSDDACRLLGVDGTLEDEIDLVFLSEPLEWIASEVASALRQAEEESEEEEDDEDEEETAPGAVSLSTIVALVRLYKLATGRALEEGELADAVIEYLNEE
ncbi:MAG TPA: hypothetical protein VFN74_02680 [Chloroflexota bacterium]|nr:hypothetical protein [Chloroflexota bacterium]